MRRCDVHTLFCRARALRACLRKLARGRSLALLLVTSSLAGLVTGCAPEGEQRSADTDSTPRRGGVAVIALDADPGTLNPVRMSSAQAARVLALLHPPLVRLDPATSEWVAGLATAWTIAASGTEVELTLDTRLRWSDGEAFGPVDVVATFELYADPVVAYPRLSRLESIRAVEILAPDRVKVSFSQPVADPLALLAHDILPAHVVATLQRDDPASWSLGRTPITLGAYRLARWQQDDRLVLERNPFHPGPGGLLDAIEIAVVPDASSRLLQLRTGEVDIVAAVPATHAAELAKDRQLGITEVYGRSVAFLQFALGDPLLADLRVRRAIDLAVDRPALVEGVLHGYARAAATFLPPASWAHDASLPVSTRDLDRARTLLDEAGFVLEGSGPRRRGDEVLRLRMLSVAGDPVREAIAVMLRAQLGEIGIEIDVRPMEMASLMRVMQSPEFQLMLGQVSGPVDADLSTFFTSQGRFNFGRYASSEADRLAAAAAGAADRDAARAAAAQLQALLAADLPVVCLYYPSTLVAHRARLRGVTPSWLSPFDGFEGWWVDDARHE